MNDADSVLTNSRRFQGFRNDLIGKIPRRPNNQVSLNAIKSKSPTDLLIIYMCWKLRNVAIRPRTITGMSSIENDDRADALKSNIEVLIKEVEAGADLSPYLSKKARHGYDMVADSEITGAVTWDDKDFLLNVMELHHFHLGRNMKSNGLMERTNEVLFARVCREEFKILGLFDHTVFEWTLDDHMVEERKRLWSICDQMQSSVNPLGGIVMGGHGNMGITGAGTPLLVTMQAISHIKIIKKFDPKLDDESYVQKLFEGRVVPEKIKLSWQYRHLDFGLVNEPSGDFIICSRYPDK